MGAGSTLPRTGTARWQVWKVPSSGEEAGSARQVTRGGGFAAIESTDGRHVYFTKRMSGTLDPQNALWRIPVEGGDEEVVVEGYRSSHGSWDLTAEGLYFVDQEPSSSGTSWVVRFQGFDRRPRDRGGTTPAPSLPRRTCHQRLVRRPLDALHPEPGRIRSDAGGELSLMQATF